MIWWRIDMYCQGWCVGLIDDFVIAFVIMYEGPSAFCQHVWDAVRCRIRMACVTHIFC